MPRTGYRIGIDVLRNQKHIDFKWSAVPEANAYIFALYQENANGRQQISRTAPENRTGWTLDNISKLDRGSYIWQVEAVNLRQDGTIERQGNIEENSFVVDIPIPGPPRLDKPGDVTVKNDTDRHVQRLTWTGDNNALRYEALIQKEEAKDYRQIQRESTAERFIEVTLTPGKYRFQVIPYDYQDKPGKESDWMTMSVAVEVPVVTGLQPELDKGRSEIFYSDNNTQILSIIGKNLVPGAEMYLRTRDGKQIIPKEIQITDDGATAMLIFENDQVTTGVYEIVVRNPGGLETSKTGVRINTPRSR